MFGVTRILCVFLSLKRLIGKASSPSLFRCPNHTNQKEKENEKQQDVDTKILFPS